MQISLVYNPAGVSRRGILRFMEFIKNVLHILEKTFVFGFESAEALDVFDFKAIGWHEPNNDTLKAGGTDIEF